MGLIAEKVRNRAKAKIRERKPTFEETRTGQASIVGYTSNGMPIYDHPPPNGNGNGRGTIVGYTDNGMPIYSPPNGSSPGACAAPPTQPQSWGAGCPTGDCPPDQLAEALGRNWSDSGPCRELPYWILMTADANGDVDFEFNSAVAMCPTRIEVVEETPLAGSRLEDLEFGNSPQMAGDPLFLAAFAPGSYQAIPWVPDCVRAGFPVQITMSGLTPDARVWFAFVGPMSG